MSDIPANILAAQAAGTIPNGMSLSYLAQSADRSEKIAVLVVGSLSFVVVLARCYARIWVIKQMGLDDVLAILTVIINIAFVVLCAKLIDNGASRHIEYIQYVLDDNTVDRIEILDSAAHLLYTTCLFTCRLSALAFYARLAFSYSKLQLAIKIAAGFLFAAFLPQMCVIIFHCRPVTFLWPFSFQVAEMSGYKCATWGPPYLVNSALSLLCDLLIFTIPAVLIKVLDIDRKKKIQLMLILFPGIFIIGISAARIYLVYINDKIPDGTWYYGDMLVIECSEITGTLTTLSVPALVPLFDYLYALVPRISRSFPGYSRDPRSLLTAGNAHGNSDTALVLTKTSAGPDEMSDDDQSRRRCDNIYIMNTPGIK